MHPRFIAKLILAIILGTSFASAAGLPAGVTERQDLPYVPGGDPAQSLDLYLPDKPSDKPLPVVVWIHGGGWSAGAKAGCPGVGMVNAGYIVASVEYRFSQKVLFPAQIQDCQAAIRWLRANSKKYNIDPDHIGAWGASAGGHLVALLGTAGGTKAFSPVGGNEDQSDRVQAVCDFFGPTDFNNVIAQAEADKNVRNVFKWNQGDPYSKLIGGKLGEDKEKGDAVSPMHYVSKESAPILILHGTKDALVPLAQSEELADALKKDGVEVTLQEIPGAGHGGPQFSTPPMLKLIKAFFDKHLKGVDAVIEPLPPEALTTAPAPAK